MKLRPYQSEALEAIDSALARGVNRQMLVLPVGAGKTVVFSRLPQRYPGRMLVLAHRAELLDQAKAKIDAANPDLSVGIEQGPRSAGASDVVVASVPTLGRTGSSRLAAYDPGDFRTIVVDEAHHAAAQTYRNVLDYFRPELLLGVTATPQRSDNVRLSDVFDEITYFKTMEDLIEAGYLATLAGYRIDTGTDISSVATRSGDYAEGELSEVINTPARNALAVQAYRKFADGKKAMVFCAGVKHAHAIATTFNNAGIACGVIDGKMASDQRAAVLADFRSGRTPVISNVGVLTEGFDEPSVEAILLARPTKSQLLYTQIVGRATRLHPGKNRALVLDLADITGNKKPVGLPTLMGLPADFDAEGEDLPTVAKKFRELEDKAPAEAARARSLADLESAWERIDLFTPPPLNPALLEYSTLVWMETGPENYVLNIPDNPFGVSRLRVSGDALGRYTVTMTRNGTAEPVGTFDGLHDAFIRSDRWVRANFSEQLALIDADAQWRADGPTDKQLKWLRKFGVPITSDLTKGQASAMLDQLFAANPKPQKKRPKWLEDKIAREKAAKRGW